MNPLQLLLLGAVAGLSYGIVIFVAMLLFGPLARAPRIAFAGIIGGTIGFFLTALVQGPFYGSAKTLSELATPLGLALAVGAGVATLCAAMLLRAPRV